MRPILLFVGLAAGLAPTKAFTTPQRKPSMSIPSRRWRPSPLVPSFSYPSSSSSSLTMMFDPTKFLQLEPPSRPESLWEALQRLPKILQKVLQGFGSSFVTGYVLAGLWGILRGPVPDRGFLWGMDLACLSTIFGGTSEVTKELLGADPSRAGPVAIRNALLAAYFKRQATLAIVFRQALFYGVLSFWVVRQSQKRQEAMGGANGMAELMKVLQGLQGADGGPGGSTANMESLFKVMQVAQQSPSSQDPFSSSATRQPPTTTKKEDLPNNNNNKEKKANAVDVEWEAVDQDPSEDPEQP